MKPESAFVANRDDGASLCDLLVRGYGARARDANFQLLWILKLHK